VIPVTKCPTCGTEVENVSQAQVKRLLRAQEDRALVAWVALILAIMWTLVGLAFIGWTLFR